MPRYRLRFFFDAGSGLCLWSGNDATRQAFGYSVDTQELPFSQNLRTRIEAALRIWETGIDWDDPGGLSPWTSEDTQRFQILTTELLENIRQELGAEFEVVDERNTLG